MAKEKFWMGEWIPAARNNLFVNTHSAVNSQVFGKKQLLRRDKVNDSWAMNFCSENW